MAEMKANKGGWLAMALALASCAIPGALRPGEKFTTRELTPEEKDALSAIVAQGLKDPEAAHFKWMPVVLRERDGITDYCGLLNGKNSYGGYIGYMRFYGQLTKDDAGRFTRIVVRWIEEPGGINITLCEAYGYSDFTLAR
jgi:hypothetical protein